MLGESAELVLELASRLGVDPGALLASAWDVAQMANSTDVDWDALLSGEQDEDMIGAGKILMGAITRHADYRRTLMAMA